MESRKKVCFACLAQPNLFNAYILSKTVYKDDYKILILSDFFCEKEYYSIIKETKGIWDEVILIKEAEVRVKDFELIKSQLRRIDFSRIDILHFFMLGYHYNNMLFNYVPKRTKIIQTVYAQATYYIKDYYLYLNETLNDPRAINADSADRISEIWVYDKRLYIGKYLKRPVKNIEISEYVKNKELLNEFCYELNKIFNYTHKVIDYDVVFLDQGLVPGVLTQKKDNELFMKLLSELKNYEVLVKNHHNSPYEKYDGFKVKNIKENKVPWELILLNDLNHENLKNKIFISYFSDTITTTHMFLEGLKIPNKTFLLIRLLQKYTKIQIAFPLLNEFYKKFKKVYSENFYDVQSIDELKNILKEK